MKQADPFIAPDPGWRIGCHALLALTARRDGDRTVLHPRERRTPYQWMPPHYQDRDDQPFVLLHNSNGGFVEGDSARLQVQAEPDTRFLITTTGANRFYKCNGGATSCDDIEVTLGPRCLFEYFPDETIPYATSRARRSLVVHADPSARLFLSDILVAGRMHYGEGERFACSSLRSETRLVVNGRTAWLDRMVLRNAAQVRDLEALWGGRTVMGTVVWYANDFPDSLVEAVAEACEAETDVCAAVSRPGRVCCMRLFGYEAWAVSEAIMRTWQLVRPSLAGKPAGPLRKP